MFPQRRKDIATLKKDLAEELVILKQHGCGFLDEDQVYALLERRIKAHPVRAHFVKNMAEYAQSNRWYSWPLSAKKQKVLYQQLPFIAEVIISVQYLHNQILDAKSGIDNQAAIANNLLAANLLKDGLYQYIEKEIPSKWRQIILRKVRRAFEYVDLGQQLEKRYNSYAQFEQAYQMDLPKLPEEVEQFIDLEAASVFIDKIKKDVPRSHWDYTDIYFQRIYLTCAALFVHLTDIVIHLLGLKQQEAKHLKNFATCYGLMRQLVNDNADLVPASLGLATNAKLASDAASDLRNRIITLPLLFHLIQSSESGIEAYLKSEIMPWDGQIAESFFEEAISSHAIYRSIQNTRILGELAANHLDKNDPRANALIESCGIVHWNKFLYPCLRHAAYKQYRKTAYSQRTRKLIRQLRSPRLVVTSPKEANRLTETVSLLNARAVIRAYNPTA